MLILVIGGSASGKSAFAENLITGDMYGSGVQAAMSTETSLTERVYIATMMLWDSEGEAKVERHRVMRSGKGFRTIERPNGLDFLEIPAGSAVLLEDLSNLAANEFFGVDRNGAAERVKRGLYKLTAAAALTVIVSNEIFLDGGGYDESTTEYVDCLAELNRWVADRADTVYEVVCGIPVLWKGSTAERAENLSSFESSGEEITD